MVGRLGEDFLHCKWLPDVTDVVVSLFNAGLATKPNLSLLFGHSSIVSNTVRDLQLKKMKNSQPSIFSIKPSTWKEGSTVWISELKIHYLTKKERMERFVNASKILFKSSRSIAFFICSTYLIFSIYSVSASQQKLLVKNMNPSIYELEGYFGADDGGLLARFGLDEISEDFPRDNLKYGAKGECYSLDDFDTIEEACRHFFDASNLEDAMLDCCRVPRLEIPNGTESKMWASDWKYKGVGVLGNKSVQRGSLIALAVDEGKCSHCKTRNFWQEA